MKIAIKGISMAPLIRLGAKITLDISPNQTYRAGDIVAYIGYRGNIVAHRVLLSALTPTGYQQYLTKGDYNCGSDRYIDEQHLLGKVQKIVYPSYTIDLTTPLSFFIARLITYSGRITVAHRWFCATDRVTIFCLTLVLTLSARWRALLRGKN